MRTTSRPGDKKPRDKDLGVIITLLDRLNTFRMPRALKLKEQVDGGEPLSSSDIQFLKQALSEGGEIRRLAAKHPEYQEVVDKMTVLYTEIVQKGTENESAGAKSKKPTQDHH
jgi:hypothetical protein